MEIATVPGVRSLKNLWKACLHPVAFSIKNMVEQLEEKGDYLGGYLKEGVYLLECLEELS